MAQKFDPITLEILWRRLISIVDEADASVARTSFSSLIRDAHDYTCVFTDAKGREICQGSLVTPGQCAGLILGIKKVCSMFPPESYKPDDVFITNDPWLFAGHLNDVCVMSPVFYKERLVAFTACIFHHSDIGGRIAADDHEVYEEGIFIPPVKIYNEGVPNEAVFDLIRWNVRTPEDVVGDIRSQVSANYVCSQRIVEMMEETGLDTLDDLADEIIERTEKSMRDTIEKIPDGVYSAEGVVEQIGGKGDIKVKLTVEIKGSDVIVDFDGTSPQVDWAANTVYNFTYAYVLYAIKTICNPEIPNNEGCALPITAKAPEGSVVNCKFPAAVGARIFVGHMVSETIYRALAPVTPKQVLAGSGASPSWLNMFYGRRHNGDKFLNVQIGGAGMGASYATDGHYPAHFPANASNIPCEIFESNTPLIMERRQLTCDSGGPGRTRGGLGYEVVFKIPDDEYAPIPPITATLLHGGRFKYPAEGLFNGKEGSLARYLINNVERKWGGVDLCNPGDTVTHIHAGGGGYGDPYERDPEVVESDVINGYVSIERAKEDYGVVIDPKTMKVDIEATQKLRRR